MSNASISKEVILMELKLSNRNLKSIVVDKSLPKPHSLLLLTGKLKSYPYEGDSDWWMLRLYTRIN